MDFRTRVWAYLDNGIWDKSVQSVRDLRSISSAALIGTTYWVNHGTYGLRSLQESGGTNIFVDARLSGSPEEIYETAYCLFLNGAAGVTVHPWIDEAGIQQALRACQASVKQTHRVDRPQIFVSSKQADRRALTESGWLRPTEREFLAHLARLAKLCGGRIITDDAQLLVAHPAQASQLVVPLSSASLSRGTLGSGVAGVLQRNARAALVPVSLLAKVQESEIDLAFRQLTQLWPLPAPEEVAEQEEEVEA
jgi:hypothetical protein